MSTPAQGMPSPPRLPALASPYKGLLPYTENDAQFFFGRDTDTDIIAANLISSRLTLLYGPSGVGKSSVLRAGVVNSLQQRTRENFAERGEPEFIVVYFNNWKDDPVPALMEEVTQAVANTPHDSTTVAAGDDAMAAPAQTAQVGQLLEGLHAETQKFTGNLLVILDQFEEFFLYHAHNTGNGTFGSEFPRALNDPNLRTNFLLSFREDALAKLDFFQGRIPNLFKNYLRIKHLDLAAAREAVVKPLERFNQLHPETPPVTIEPALVEAVLSQVQVGHVVLGETGRGAVAQENQDAEIETPYLQLVLTRLWERERMAESNVLHLATLEQLGGAEEIVRAHLQQAIDDLTPEQQAIAASVFDRLVTPSGTKIAQTARDLARYAHVSESELDVVLERLAGGQNRILRPVAPSSDRPDAPRYEIFHDVLSGAILEWRGKYEKEQEQKNLQAEMARQRAETDRENALKDQRLRARRFQFALLGAVLGLFIFAGIAVFAYQQRQDAVQQRQDALNSVASLRVQIAGAQTQVASSQQQAANAQAVANSVLTALPQGSQTANPTAGVIRQTAEAVSTSAASALSYITSVAINSKFQFGASGNADNTIQLWNAADGSQITVLKGHTGSVRSVAFCSSGTSLASGSDDNTIRLWDVRDTNQVQPFGAPLKGHTGSVTSVAFTPDNNTLASGSLDQTIRLWDVTDEARPKALGSPLVGHTAAVTSVAFSPDGKTLVSASLDGTVRLWDVRDLAHVSPLGRPLVEQTAGINSIVFSPDGSLVAFGSSDDTVQIWDVTTGKQSANLIGHLGSVFAVAFSPDGNLLSSGSADSTIRLWEVATGRTLGAPQSEAQAFITALIFSSDGKTLISGSSKNKLQFWDVASIKISPAGQILTAAETPTQTPTPIPIQFNSTVSVPPTATVPSKPTFTPVPATRVPTQSAAVLPANAKLVFVSTRDGNGVYFLYEMDLQTRGVRRITRDVNATQNFEPYYAVATGQIAFMRKQTIRAGEEWNIFTSDLDGNLTQLTRSEFNNWHPAWSADGRELVFTTSRFNDKGELYVVGNFDQRMTNNPATDIWPAWSPDSKKIVFASNRGDPTGQDFDLYTLDADPFDAVNGIVNPESTVKPLTHGAGSDLHPRWSPNGQQIVYRHVEKDTNGDGRIDEQDLGGIWIVNADGSNPHNITPRDSLENYPTWSPDGQWIAFSRWINNIPQLFVMTVDGGNTIQLTSGDASNFEPTWEP